MDNLEEVIKYSQTLKLLYVEDNEEAREVTLMILGEFFNEIIVAEDGQEGFEKFQENDFDLIITDINMPRLTGLEMTKLIRESGSDIHILVLSAYNESGFFIDSIKLDVEGYLLKPIDIDQFLSVLQKVTSKLKLKEEADNYIFFLKQYEKATNHSSIVSKTNLEGIITYVNDDFCKISGYEEHEIVGQNHNIVRHPDNPDSIYKKLWSTIKDEQKTWKGLLRNRAKNGKSYYVKTTVIPILDSKNNTVEYISLRDDITDIMNPKKQLDDAIKSFAKPVVVYMKLEEFEILEEFYESSVIQEIKEKTTYYLEENLPKDCTFEKVYQLGHGEYAMTQDRSVCMQDEKLFMQQIKAFQEKIRAIVGEIGGIDYDMSIIISLAYENNHVLESARLGIRELLKTKQDFIIANNYAQVEHKKAQKNMKTINMIKKAINDFKIVSYFQPIINNKTKEIEKYESLVRLIDENGEIISPFFFLDVAKKGKYYSQITAMVLNNSFGALQNTDMDISINVSALDIERKSTRDRLFTLLEQHKQYASRIVFELLEDESVKDFKTIKRFIYDVKELSARIAIDDFGAGYSNFERLLDYQPDILKIDGCLIRDIETNAYSRSVVETIVSFAKKQNIKTIAEYVENEQIFNILNEMGVDYSQGYHFGKALPLDA